MKALEWQFFLQNQRERHGKVLFTPTELANAAVCSDAVIRVTVRRLLGRGVLQRYANGVYGMPGIVTVEDLVPALDRGAYVTGLYALHRHGIVTQRPTTVTCFTNRRHNRSRVRVTPLGRIVFTCVAEAIYSMPSACDMAFPEQALCDFVYECRRDGLQPESLVTFRKTDCLDRERLASVLSRYPATVSSMVERIAGSRPPSI